MGRQVNVIVFITMVGMALIWSQQISAVPEGNPLTQDSVQEELSKFNEDVRNGATFKFKIHKSLPAYTFHLVGNRESNLIDSIEVSKGNDTAIIQVLKDFEMDEPPFRGAKYFQAEDINFDGYRDLKLLSWWGVTGNKGYSYWLFEPKKNRFVFNQELRDLSNPTPNYKRKLIKTHSVGGMAGYIYENADYAFVNGRLVSIREEVQDLAKIGSISLGLSGNEGMERW